MIRINLIGKKKRSEEVIVFGVNFKSINWVGIILAFILMYTFPVIVDYYMLPKLVQYDSKIKKNRQKIKKIRLKLKNNKKLRDQIDVFDKRKKKLITISKTIESIISSRNNPFHLLYFLAKNMPDDLWFEKILIKDKKFVLHGATSNNMYVAILVNSLNNSYYFNKRADVSNIKKNERKEKKYFNFKLETSIERFNE